MAIKILCLGFSLLLLSGIIYLGTIGISVAPYSAHVEMPLKQFLNKTA